MEVLQQAYPRAPEVRLEEALNDAWGDVIDALELLRDQIGEPDPG